MSVLIFADAPNGKLVKSANEATYYGSKIAAQLGSKAIVVTYGNADNDSLSKLGNYGATKVLVAKNLNHSDPQQLTRIMVKAAENEGVSILVFSHDYTGKAVAPRVAARLNAGFVPGVIEFPQIGSAFTVKRTVFSGKAFAIFEIGSEKKVVSLLPNSVPVEKSDNLAEVVEFNADPGLSGIVIKEVKKDEETGVLLPEAEIVVSGGRGLKGPENWGMIEDLAKTLGAATACSRPVADIGWRPHHEHVGQTGLAIRPNLYFAIGISGAIQHLAGVNGSKVIVVINTDKEAPFFKAADYGIVGDAFEVVPKLIEAAKKFKASHN